MSITVDQEPLAAGEMGLTTLGEVLAHLQHERKLVIQLLIDGQEPHLEQLPALRQTMLSAHTIYIETADPRKLALEVLAEIAEHLPESDRLRIEAAELFQQSQPAKGLEQLSCCIRIWQHAQESLSKVGELLRLDLESVEIGGRSLQQLLSEFPDQLREIKSALEQRDFVSLADVLLYGMEQTSATWGGAVEKVKQLVETMK